LKVLVLWINKPWREIRLLIVLKILYCCSQGKAIIYNEDSLTKKHKVKSTTSWQAPSRFLYPFLKVIAKKKVPVLNYVIRYQTSDFLKRDWFSSILITWQMYLNFHQTRHQATYKNASEKKNYSTITFLMPLISTSY